MPDTAVGALKPSHSPSIAARGLKGATPLLPLAWSGRAGRRGAPGEEERLVPAEYEGCQYGHLPWVRCWGDSLSTQSLRNGAACFRHFK